MTIEPLDSGKVLISLCAKDMKDYKIDLNCMSLYDEHSNKVLQRLLRLACSKAGLSMGDKVALMEAVPWDGGCLILVTLCHKKKPKTYKVKRVEEYPCFMFQSIEDFFSVSEKILGRGFAVRNNSLWEYKCRLYLVWNYPVISSELKGILTEYATMLKCNKVTYSRIKEQGRLLCEDNAIEKIGRSILP